MSGDESWPPYTYVPGGPWPHPTGSAQGHSFGRVPPPESPVEGDGWSRSAMYLRGIALFNAGYYWEAHEAWEALWHAHGRKGPTADVIKGLIKLAAAGVKVREGQPHGITTHARRAADLFAKVRDETGRHLLGLDLDQCAGLARGLAEAPPVDDGPADARVSRVFAFTIEPRA
ncbi:MAG: DUF309 domain-containing protein [Planctomycetia bacterium]|nr:DUF309 domain-containing protein [Planctomycetia bacterium]